MGRERTWAGKQIYLYFAVLILAFTVFSGCSFLRTVESKIAKSKRLDRIEEARRHLSLGRNFLAQGDYVNALRENEQAMSLAGSRSPADEALFWVGLIYAYPANPAKDYGKSVICLQKLIKDYPKSLRVREARAMVGLLQENNKNNKRIERLNTIIEESKKVDMEIQERRRERKRDGWSRAFGKDFGS